MSFLLVKVVSIHIPSNFDVVLVWCIFYDSWTPEYCYHYGLPSLHLVDFYVSPIILSLDHVGEIFTTVISMSTFDSYTERIMDLQSGDP